MHAALELGGGAILPGCPGPDYRCPRRIGQTTQNLYVYVDDVERHFRTAQGAGATILSGPEDTFYDDRRYGAEDLEDHHCMLPARGRIAGRRSILGWLAAGGS